MLGELLFSLTVFIDGDVTLGANESFSGVFTCCPRRLLIPVRQRRSVCVCLICWRVNWFSVDRCNSASILRHAERRNSAVVFNRIEAGPRRSGVEVKGYFNQGTQLADRIISSLSNAAEAEGADFSLSGDEAISESPQAPFSISAHDATY
jgi:hypothetical protein